MEKWVPVFFKRHLTPEAFLDLTGAYFTILVALPYILMV
jgi:hypothetical protein